MLKVIVCWPGSTNNMVHNLQKVVDDTVVIYNSVYTKTYKSIVRSRVYRQYIGSLTDNQAVISQTVLKKIATRQPFTKKITLIKSPSDNDIAVLKQNLGA